MRSAALLLLILTGVAGCGATPIGFAAWAHQQDVRVAQATDRVYDASAAWTAFAASCERRRGVMMRNAEGHHVCLDNFGPDAGWQRMSREYESGTDAGPGDSTADGGSGAGAAAATSPGGGSSGGSGNGGACR
jgi:hypothetical protein